MKTIRLYSILALAATMVSSCTDDSLNMLTVVNEDGSCTREFSVRMDSAGLVGKESTKYSNIIEDAEWIKTWAIMGEEERHTYPMTANQYDSIQAILNDKGECMNVRDTVVVYATRTFADAEEMDKASNEVFGGTGITSEIELDRSFKWFYTDYTFTETFRKIPDLELVPMTDYLTEDEISYECTGFPNLVNGLDCNEAKKLLDDLENRSSKWTDANTFKDVFDVIYNNYDRIGNAPVTKEEFRKLEDSLWESMQNRDFTFEAETCYSEFFGTDAYSSIFNDEELPFKTRKIMNLASISIPYRLVMPGSITDSGNSFLEDNTAIFKVSGTYLIHSDYTISATSRRANIWAYIITGFILFLAIGSFIIKGKRQ